MNRMNINKTTMKTNLFFSFLGCCITISMACGPTNSTGPQEDGTEQGATAQAQTVAATDSYETAAQQDISRGLAEPNKYALIIAIGDYPKSSGWNPISSPNDVPLVKAALAAQGFDTLQHVVVIRDREATKKGILDALQKHLTNKVMAGDVVVIHYSGHGQQAWDMGEKDEYDGYDEALVPYDAPMRFIKGKYEGENHLRDDELQEALTQLRTKLGTDGNLLVVLDACHSGTATRGIGKYRGTKVIMAPDDYVPQPRDKSRGSSDHEWAENTAGDGLAPMVVISGASADELNFETKDEQGRDVGSLSYAFSRAVTQATNTTSYRGLFDQIRVDMSAFAPRQTPQIEGTVDQQLFGGNAVAPQKYFKVQQWYDAENVTISGGELFGLFEGSEVAFYDIDIADTTGVPPKATGKIIYSAFIESDVQLNTTLSEKEARNSWVFVKTQNFGDMGVQVQLDIRNNGDLEKAIREFNKASLIKIVNEDPELLVEMNTQYTTGRGANTLQIVTANEYTIMTTSLADIKEEDNFDNLAEGITESVVAFAQAKFLRKLEMNDPNLDVTMEIIPITVKQVGQRKVEDKRLDIQEKINQEGVLELKEGDYFKVKLINQGQKTAYYCALDIQPDNVINVLIPVHDFMGRMVRSPEEYKIAPEASIELDEVFVVGPPFGMENFKLIATEKVLDITPLVKTRGEDSRGGPFSPFEILIKDSYKKDKSTTRSAGTASVPPASGNIETLLFRIIE